jgi:hypothetical protein
VVQIGVKSFGCEKSTAQESPIQSWMLIRPSVESASKSGAVSPSCSPIVASLALILGEDAPDEMVDAIWALVSPQVFSMLTEGRGWSSERAEAWLVQMSGAACH